MPAKALSFSVHALTPAHAQAFHTLRLQALAAHPESFAASVEEQCALPLPSVAQSLAAGDQQFVMGAWHTGELIATVGLQRQKAAKLAHKASLWGVYVHPAFRGHGVAQALLTATLVRARQMHGLQQIQLGVASHNLAAIALYERHGFVRFAVERQSLCSQGKFYDENWMVLAL